MMKDSGLSDAGILRLVLGGERGAFRVVVERYAGVVHGVAYARLRNHDDADDATQEVFLRAFQSLHKLRRPRSVGPWLVTMVKNHCVDVLRKRAREGAAKDAVQREPPRMAVTPEREELCRLLWEEMEKLDESAREVLVLHYFSGKKTREIGSLLGISRSAAAKRLQRARQALGERMTDTVGRQLAALEEDPKQRASRVMGAIATATAPWEDAAQAAGGLPGWASAANTGALKAVMVAACVVAVGGAVLLAARPDTRGNLTTPVPAASPRDMSETLSAPPVEPPSSASPQLSPPKEPPEPQAAPEVTVDVGRITGMVLDPLGEPQPGVEVVLERKVGASAEGLLGEYRRTATTDDGGQFVFDRIPLAVDPRLLPYGNKFYLTADAGDHCATDIFYANNPRREEYFELVLNPNVPLVGVVTDEDGDPVAQAEITATIREMSVECYRGIFAGLGTTTDASGRFRLGRLFPASYEVTAHAQGYRPQTVPDVVPGEGQLRITLRPGGTIEGAVVDARTRLRLPDVPVVAFARWPQPRRHATSDPEGFFKLDSLGEAAYTVYPGGGGYVLVHDPPKVSVTAGGGPWEVELEVAQGAVVAGRVFDAVSRAPLTGVSVLAKPKAGSPYSGHAETAEDGTYRIEGLAAGAHGVYARDGDRNSPTVAVEAVLGRRYEGIDLPVPPLPAYEIRGRVIGMDGNPSDGASVLARFGEVRVWSAAVSGADGGFVIRRAEPAETVFLQAMDERGCSPREGPFALTDSGPHDVVLKIAPAGRLEGRVVDSGGRGVRRAVLVATPRNESSRSILPTPSGNREHVSEIRVAEFAEGIMCETLLSGRFSFGMLPPDTYNVQVYTEASVAGVPIASAVARVQPGADGTPLRIVVAASGGAVEGRVTRRGEPLAGQKVQVSYPIEAGVGGRPNARTDADGQYRIEGLPEGLAFVEVVQTTGAVGAWARREMGRSVEIVEGRTVVADFGFGTESATLEGTVRINGQPALDAAVMVQFVDADGQSEETSARTDALGRYRIADLPQGIHHVRMVRFRRDETGQTGIMRDTVVETVTGEITRLDFDIHSGSVQGVLKGLRDGERGTAAFVQGEIVIESLEVATIEAVREQAVETVELEANGPFRVGDLEPGLYTLFVAAYPETAADVAEALPSLRLTAVLIEVAEGRPAQIDVTLE